MHPEHGASQPGGLRAATAQAMAMAPRQAQPSRPPRLSPARAQPQVKDEEWAAF